MKQELFVVTVRATEMFIKISDWIFGLIAAVPVNLGLLSRGFFAQVGYRILILLDKEQVDRSNGILPEGEQELHRQQVELQLLSAASMVRDNYLETGEWTEQHTEALEALSNQLLNECDWEEEHIHQYMRSVVEAGTDLNYGIDEG
jgi:hypothetical protein